MRRQIEFSTSMHLSSEHLIPKNGWVWVEIRKVVEVLELLLEKIQKFGFVTDFNF
jgi:hypothetical protein